MAGPCWLSTYLSCFKHDVNASDRVLANFETPKREVIIVNSEDPPGVFGEQGNTGNLAMGTREQSKKRMEQGNIK